MIRRLATMAIAGLIATGGVLFAQAPAFAATTPGVNNAAAGMHCVYKGYFIGSNGVRRDIYDCTE